VPTDVRLRLDRALLRRPAGAASLEAVAARFHLQEEYGVGPTALRTYARRLDDMVRPVLTSQLLAAALGCLPRDFRDRLIAGSEVVLLSRLVQALTAEEAEPLSVADLGRLATILSGLARRAGSHGPGRRTPGDRRAGTGLRAGDVLRDGIDDASLAPGDPPPRLAEAVKMLYGIDLGSSTGEAGPDTDSIARPGK
jgi:hypothetical protein